MKQTVMEMYQYSALLGQTNFNYSKEGFSYRLDTSMQVEFDIPIKKGDFYIKVFPLKTVGHNLIEIQMESEKIDKEIANIKVFTIAVQVVLLFVFMCISYLLAKISLRPMQDTIVYLDRFLSDLIHDLNTPATSILLNINMILKNESDAKKRKQLQRIQTSADTIASLHENLELILEPVFQLETIAMKPLLTNITEDYKLLYPHIDFKLSLQSNRTLYSDKKALLKIIDNILSNSAKYSTIEPKITITCENNTLIIQDNGKGMRYPQKIFERRYKESEQGYGIGMDIVHRLCDGLGINITIDSQQNKGTKVELYFSKNIVD